MAYMADDLYGPLPGPNGVVAELSPAGAPTSPVNPPPGPGPAATSHQARQPAAGGITRAVAGAGPGAAPLSLRGFFTDPTGWLVMCIGAAFLLANYAATGRLIPG